MKTALGLFIQLIGFTASSASLFMLSNIVSPIKSVVTHPPTQISKMTIRFDEFSPAFAALEDDYYVSTYEEEQIPTDIIAQEIKPGTFDLLNEKIKTIALPTMALNSRQNLEELTLQPIIPIEEMKLQRERPAQEVVAEIQKNNQQFIQLPHYWLQGKFELSEGLAISDPRDVIQLGWFVDGEKRRDGKISLRDGTYEIKVDQLEGELIAELVDKKGFLLGEAIIDLEVLRQQRNISTLVISNVDIKLVPYSFGLKAQTLSVYGSKNHPQPVAKAEISIGDHDASYRTKDTGKLHEESVSPHSTGLLIANTTLHRDSLVLADLEREQQIVMFPEKFMNAFFETIQLTKQLRAGGVIWGVINKGKTPARDYRLRLVENKNLQPIYSMLYIANTKLEKTSDDGQAIFVGLDDGEYEVEVIDALDKVVDSKLVAVRAGAVSSINFEVADKRTIKMRAFDPLSQSQKSVEFFALGQEGPMNVKTEEILALPVSPGQEPILVYTKLVDSKVESTTFASRNRKFQDVPVLNSQWWSRIQGEQNISISSGVIVGFIDAQESFEVFIERPSENTKIFYLNSRGEIIKDKNSGQKPSGFLIFGVGPGLHTLIIESEQGLLHTEAAYVDSEAVALMYKAL